MSAEAPTTKELFSNNAAEKMTTGDRTRSLLAAVPTTVLWLIVILWTVPTIGLFVTALRPKEDITATGWWRTTELTFQNYIDVWNSGINTNFWNTLAIVIPATIIPVALATIAAYGFAWIPFKGRSWVFVLSISMLALPNQMTLVPLLRFYNSGAAWTIPFTDTTIQVFPDLDIAGTFASVWLTHTAFGLPLAIFLLHNYISGLPADLFEAARIDGATHFTIFTKLVIPLSLPAIASFAIFQFLWTWNDFLIASVFLSDNAKDPLTVALVNLAGAQGQNAYLQYPAGFFSILIPLIVFFSLQRYFVRGLLAGSVKG